MTRAGQEAARVYQAAIEQRRFASQGSVYAPGPLTDWWNALLAELQKKADGYAACLAASSDDKAGDAEQKAQAETTCAGRAGPK